MMARAVLVGVCPPVTAKKCYDSWTGLPSSQIRVILMGHSKLCLFVRGFCFCFLILRHTQQWYLIWWRSFHRRRIEEQTKYNHINLNYHCYQYQPGDVLQICTTTARWCPSNLHHYCQVMPFKPAPLLPGDVIQICTTTARWCHSNLSQFRPSYHTYTTRPYEKRRVKCSQKKGGGGS